MDKPIAVVTGASSGLGKLIAEKITATYDVMAFLGDVRNETEIKNFSYRLTHPIDVLVNCAGVNDIEYIPDLKSEAWDKIIDTNAKGIYLMAKTLLEQLRGGTILNIVSNASHIPMTGSLAYNASKGAAAIMTKQMARELKKTHDITVFAVSPNKLAGTEMSKYIDRRVVEMRKWTEEEARAYQLASLPAGEETDPDTLAEFIAFLLSTKQRHKYLNGVDIPYGGP